MKTLGIDNNQLKTLEAFHTANEINQQPAMWRKTWDIVSDRRSEISVFLDRAFDKIILTGAGTSAYIGESLTGSFFRKRDLSTCAIPTTNLVSHPYDYFASDECILLVSFARSGNSPESKAAADLADTICKECYHLIITCNESGELALNESKLEKLVVCLPEQTNDKSLAMTSSYTCMLLAGLLIGRLPELDKLKNQVELAATYGQEILDSYTTLLAEIAKLPFKRAVFLGSGPMLGTATEASLKLQELTDGRILCKHESFLGFRHGPKAVVDEDTLVVYILSNDEYVSKYEYDLVFAMKKGKQAIAQLAIAERLDYDLDVDYKIQYTLNGNVLDESFMTLPGILPGQLLGFFKSLEEGLMPDTPSSSGAISRVVQGVNIYRLPE